MSGRSTTRTPKQAPQQGSQASSSQSSSSTSRTTTSEHITVTTTTSLHAIQAGGSTTIGGSTSTLQVGERPVSPVILTRQQERQEFGSLNERLAALIDRNRLLDLENSRLSQSITTMEASINEERNKLKGVYESEMIGLRRALDQTANENAALKMEKTKLESGYNEAMSNLGRVQGQLKDLQSREAKISQERDEIFRECEKLRGEVKPLKDEVDGLRGQSEGARRQLEAATLRCAKLENELHTANESLNFEKQLKESVSLEKSMTIRKVTEESRSRIQAEYDTKFQDELRHVREDYNKELKRALEESQRKFEDQVRLSETNSQRNTDQIERTRREVTESQRQVDLYKSQIIGLQNDNATLKAQLSALQGQLDREQEMWRKAEEDYKQALERLRAEFAAKDLECREAMAEKISFQQELAIYRSLLESEETRLNITPTSTSLLDVSAHADDSGPPSRKRRIEETRTTTSSMRSMPSSYSSDNFEIVNNFSGSVSIEDVGYPARYVALANTSDSEVSLGGWQLKARSKSEGKEAVEINYKFQRNASISANQTIRVWSYEAAQVDKIQASATDLIMPKGTRWVATPNFEIILLNKENQETASSKINMRASSLLGSTPTRGLLGRSTVNGDGSQSEGHGTQCALM